MALFSKDSFTLSSVGPQLQSTKPTQPTYKFSVAPKDDIAKLYISKEQDKLIPSRWSPGAIYGVHSTLNRSTGFSFGKAPRGSSLVKKGSEDLTKSLPDSQLFKFSGTKTILFGTSTRPPLLITTDTPGPGTYDGPDASLVPQATIPGISFGLKTKPLGSLPQTSEELGPGVYPLPDSVGPQFESTKENIRIVKFSKASRNAGRKSRKTPSTVIDYIETAIGPQISSKYESTKSMRFTTASRERVNKLALCITDGDKGRAAIPLRLPHPELPMEKDLVRWS
jgi:hypothetical protein